MKVKCLGFILSVEDCERFIKTNKELINELSKILRNLCYQCLNLRLK